MLAGRAQRRRTQLPGDGGTSSRCGVSCGHIEEFRAGFRLGGQLSWQAQEEHLASALVHMSTGKMVSDCYDRHMPPNAGGRCGGNGSTRD